MTRTDTVEMGLRRELLHPPGQSISLATLMGRSVLRRDILQEMQRGTMREELSKHDWVRRVINGHILMGRGSYDCNFLHIHIGHHDRAVVEQVLAEYEAAGWGRPFISHEDQEHGITIALIT